MENIWIVIKELIHHIIARPIPLKVEERILFTNKKFNLHDLKTNFKYSNNSIICNINEEDKEKFKDYQLFINFIYNIYFNKDTIFGYQMETFRGDEGMNFLNSLLYKYNIPYTVRVNSNYKVIIYELGRNIILY